MIILIPMVKRVTGLIFISLTLLQIGFSGKKSELPNKPSNSYRQKEFS